MSEKYGPCETCDGYGEVVVSSTNVTYSTKLVECGTCGGTGFSGNAARYYERELNRDRMLPRASSHFWESKK